MTPVPWDGKFEDVLRATLPGIEPTTPLLPDAPMRGYGLDSMSMMLIITRLEETYCVSLPPKALVPATFETPGAVWGALQTALDALWAKSLGSPFAAL